MTDQLIKTKFRGIRHVGGQHGLWANGPGMYVVELPSRDMVFIRTGERTPQNQWNGFVEIHPETFGMFTGAYEYDPTSDENTAEIYTGDRCVLNGMSPGIPHDGREGVVKFYESAFWLDFGDDAVPVWSESYYLTVVGNIHEKFLDK
jgi:hypothetical protein